MDITHLTDCFGSEVRGIDLSEPMDESTFRQLENEFNSRSVLVLRDQKMSEAQHISFSRRFGDLEIHVLRQYLLPEKPEILLISNMMADGKPIGISDAGQYWHTDLSYVEKPSRCSILYGRKIPEPRNGVTFGDTCFVSTSAAYDALDRDAQDFLSTLEARHSYSVRYDAVKDGERSARAPLTKEQREKVQDVVHPVIRTHPVTGRKCIYVNEGFTSEIIGMDPEEGAALLDRLFKHCQSEQFMYRHKWRVGDVLMWDNCATQHLAIPDYGPDQHRLMHRTTVSGGAVF